MFPLFMCPGEADGGYVDLRRLFIPGPALASSGGIAKLQIAASLSPCKFKVRNGPCPPKNPGPPLGNYSCGMPAVTDGVRAKRGV